MRQDLISNHYHFRRRLTLAKQNTFLVPENTHTQTDASVSADLTQTTKKQFVEPEISTPVDVLEATTFFQAISSGSTN